MSAANVFMEKYEKCPLFQVEKKAPYVELVCETVPDCTYTSMTQHLIGCFFQPKSTNIFLISQ